jgi:hypothetical protein
LGTLAVGGREFLGAGYQHREQLLQSLQTDERLRTTADRGDAGPGGSRAGARKLSTLGGAGLHGPRNPCAHKGSWRLLKQIGLSF